MSEGDRTLAERMTSFDNDYDKQIAERGEQLVEVGGEIERIQEALESLQSQLEQLRATKSALEAAESQSITKVEAGNQLLFETLQARAAALVERNQELVQLNQQRDQRVAEALIDETGSKLMSDYNKFETETMPVLEALPESYRPLLLAKHDETKAALAAHVEAARGGPVTSDEDPIVVEVAYAIDAPDGPAELITLIIPVPASVQVAWAERAEDLHTHLAARAVQGVYQGFHLLGIPESQCFFGEHHEMLVVEAEIPEGHVKQPDEVQAALDAAFEEAFSTAGELQRAKVRAQPYRAPTEYLLPPEGEEPLDDEPGMPDEGPGPAYA